jgi:hypothetical protein
MKTFEQFLSEAHASQRDIAGSKRFLNGPHGTINISSTRRKRENTERNQRLSNLPAGTGTAASAGRRDIESQMAAQQATINAEKEKQKKLALAAQILAAQRENPEEEAKRKKAQRARERSARRAAKKAKDS